MNFAPDGQRQSGQKLGQIFEKEFGVEPGSFFDLRGLLRRKKIRAAFAVSPALSNFFPPADITYALLDILPRAMVKLKNAQRRE